MAEGVLGIIMGKQLSPELSKAVAEFKSYLQTEDGKLHFNYLKVKEPTETKNVLKRLHSLPIQSDEFVERVLYGLLPNFKTKYAKRVSVSPSFMNIRKFFGRFNYSENDWKELSLLVYNLISKFEQNPSHLDEYIRDFISYKLSKGLQCGSVSPIFFALNPKFPIINNREKQTYDELSFHVLDLEDELSQRLENYISNVSKVDKLIEVLGKDYAFKEVGDYAIFDLFCFWYTERNKLVRKTKVQKVRQATPQGSPIEDREMANFIQAMKCSDPRAFFIGMTDGPLNLYKLDSDGRIIYNTEFQRGEVWDKPSARAALSLNSE
jgi:hypothetical protein